MKAVNPRQLFAGDNIFSWTYINDSMIYISQKMEDHRAAHEYLFKGFKGFKLPKMVSGEIYQSIPINYNL